MQFSCCLYSDKECVILTFHQLCMLNFNLFMIFDWGLFCCSQRFVYYVDGCHGNCGQSPVRFEVHSGTLAWHSCLRVNLLLNYPATVINVLLNGPYFDIGIWQRLLDVYFENHHFECFFCSNNCFYFASKDQFLQLKWFSMKQ